LHSGLTRSKQSFVSQERFCFRACKPSAAASAACPQIHDIVECSDIVPGNYDTGVFEDCVGDAIEVLSTLDQEVLADSAHLASSCRTRGTIGDAQVTHARRAIPMVVPSLPHPHFRSHSHRTPMSSCLAPTTTDTTTNTFPTSPLNATTFVNTSTPVASNSLPPCSYNHTHTHSRSHWRARGHAATSHDHSSTSCQLSSYRPRSFEHRILTLDPLPRASTVSASYVVVVHVAYRHCTPFVHDIHHRPTLALPDILFGNTYVICHIHLHSRIPTPTIHDLRLFLLLTECPLRSLEFPPSPGFIV
jgi:hypothetical protein